MNQKDALKGLRILYPIWAVMGMLSLVYIPSKLITLDAGQTAQNILENQFLFKLGIVGGLFTQLFFIFTVIMLYHLFKTVSQMCTMNMLIFSLVSVPIAMVSSLGLIAALELAPTNESLMMLFINLNNQGIIIASISGGFGFCRLAIWLGSQAIFQSLSVSRFSLAVPVIFSVRLQNFFLLIQKISCPCLIS
jgi:hypothetical protein